MNYALVRPHPDLDQLSISRSQNRVFEKGKRRLETIDLEVISAAVSRGPTRVVALGLEEDADALRKGLALGAESALLLVHPAARDFDGYVRTQVLSAALKDVGYVVAGPGQTGPRLSEEKGWGVVLLEDAVTPWPSGPAVVVLRPGIYKPTLPTAMAIMKSAKKPLEVRSVPELGLSDDDLRPRQRVVGAYLNE
jgi:electron transfer flavoprotein alpha/beta subunit